MRFLVDANISYRLVETLRQRGHDTRSVLEEDPNAPDEYIVRWAARLKRTIITYDKDFGELVFKFGNRHYGVIILRTRDESYHAQFKLIEKFLSSHTPKEIRANFWVLTDTAIRKTKSQ